MIEQPKISTLLDHLFRMEAGKLVPILTGIFGTENIDLAEDVVQDALIEALDDWQYNGVPNNPSAWLFRVAKNKALNIINRENYKRRYAKEAMHQLTPGIIEERVFDKVFLEDEIQDDQLRMIFTCCHPALTADSQIALALKTLCGFSIAEIARAFFTTEENINKRLVRARQKVRDEKIPFEVPQGKELEKRLQVVLETIYLLFNEGYSASKGDEIIRYELCGEAIRLAQIITDSPNIAEKENVFALLALMFFNASRFKARQDSEGNLLTLQEQDRSLWDGKLKIAALNYLIKAANNESISIYHILAAISAEYCIAPDYDSTNWQSVLSLYDSLVVLDDSPVVLLNRAIAVSKVHGAAEALKEIGQIGNTPALQSYYLLYSTLAELYIQLGQFENAATQLEKAIQLAPLQSEKSLLKKKLEVCRQKIV